MHGGTGGQGISEALAQGVVVTGTVVIKRVAN